MLTADEVKYGYWGEKYHSAKLPNIVIEAKEYNGGDVLRVACTQLNATASHQKHVISEWCEVLPHLSQVKTLCFESRVNQRLFDAVCQMPNLEALYIKWGGIKSVANITSSQTLHVLSLGSNPGVRDIEEVRNLSQLNVLELENIPGAHDLTFVAGLENLEALSVDGSISTTQAVDSLKPLKTLHNLKFLSLVSTKVREGGLMPLLEIKSLIHVRSTLRFPAAEFAALRAGLPLLRYGTPFNEDAIRQYAKR